MPKKLFIDPLKVRKPGKITFGEIPLNQYQKTLAEEKDHYTREELLAIYRDMMVIREFETMLNKIKTTNEYEGISYNHPGPAHLSIGQEAAAVGMAWLLGPEDYIFGSHRSHGEILAKGMSAIRKLNDNALLDTMKNYMEGTTLKVVEQEQHPDVHDLALDFLLYGTLAEIFSTKAWADRCMLSSLPSAFTPTMPS